jgi:ABC-type protease/lipase transport system fused ATPase/permease subunit
VAENIARFSPDPNAEAVLAAAGANARQILARPPQRANGRLPAEGADR